MAKKIGKAKFDNDSLLSLVQEYDAEAPSTQCADRRERRRCDAVDLADPEWDGCCDLYGRKQAIRIRRTIECVKTGTRSEETT